MAAIEAIYRISERNDYDISQSRCSRLAATLSWIARRMECRRTRMALLEMTDDQLKDIGLSRTDAYGEARRPFWA